MLSLSRLLALQWVFAGAAVAYLIASVMRQQITGAPLSAAVIGPSLLMFVAYMGLLRLPRIGRVGWYWPGMIPALLLFGGGGVIANIARFLSGETGAYVGIAAWVLAVAINAYGTVLNLLAVFGWFEDEPAAGGQSHS